MLGRDVFAAPGSARADGAMTCRHTRFRFSIWCRRWRRCSSASMIAARADRVARHPGGALYSADTRRARRRDRVEFSTLFEDLADRSLVIATFMALLELIRRGEVRAWQETRIGADFSARARRAARRPNPGGRRGRRAAKGDPRKPAFAAGEPVWIRAAGRGLDNVPRETIHKALAEMAADVQRRAAASCSKRSPAATSCARPRSTRSYVRKLLAAKPPRLSRPLMETLAIIAYRQPITRPEIEQLRGVDSGGVLDTLLERRLVKIAGRKEAPGRPMVYATTAEFLELFG